MSDKIVWDGLAFDKIRTQYCSIKSIHRNFLTMQRSFLPDPRKYKCFKCNHKFEMGETFGLATCNNHNNILLCHPCIDNFPKEQPNDQR